MTHALATSLGRLERLLGDCVAAMEAGEALDHGATTDAKVRALLELSRHGRGSLDAAPEELAPLVARVREALAREARLLAVRKEAAALVADLVAEAVMAEEADGTYDWRPPGAGAEARP